MGMDKALALPKSLGNDRPPVPGLSELVAESGMDRAACYRGLSALVL